MRGWNPAYQESCIDLMDQSHPLDPTSMGPLSILAVPSRLLNKDTKTITIILAVVETTLQFYFE